MNEIIFMNRPPYTNRDDIGMAHAVGPGLVQVGRD